MARNLSLLSRLQEVVVTNGQTATRNAPFRRSFVTASRPLQESDKEAEQCKNVKEAAEAVKEGAKQVKETTEFIRDVAANAAGSVTKMSKAVTEKVSDAADAITQKAKGSVTGAWGAGKSATEVIKEKASGN